MNPTGENARMKTWGDMVKSLPFLISSSFSLIVFKWCHKILGKRIKLELIGQCLFTVAYVFDNEFLLKSPVDTYVLETIGLLLTPIQITFPPRKWPCEYTDHWNCPPRVQLFRHVPLRAYACMHQWAVKPPPPSAKHPACQPAESIPCWMGHMRTEWCASPVRALVGWRVVIGTSFTSTMAISAPPRGNTNHSNTAQCLLH